MEDLDIEDEDDGEEGGNGGFMPLREDAVQCYREHTSKAYCCKIVIEMSSRK